MVQLSDVECLRVEVEKLSSEIAKLREQSQLEPQLRKVNLKPDDVLVFRLSSDFGTEPGIYVEERIREYLKERGINNRAVVLPCGVELEIMSQSPVPCAVVNE